METLLIKPKDKEEFDLVQSILKRMRIKTEIVEKKNKKQRKEEFLESLEGRLQEVERAERGEIKLKNAYDLLNEL
jgi:hypothetical protein